MNPWPVIARSVTVQGIYVGSRAMFEDMTRAIVQNGLKPVIDRVFEFARRARRVRAHGGREALREDCRAAVIRTECGTFQPALDSAALSK